MKKLQNAEPDYKKMYLKLFNDVTDAIRIGGEFTNTDC